MKKHFQIAVLFLIGLFFISTTGVVVYKHYCAHDGLFYNVFFNVSHDCEHEPVVTDDCDHACCQIEDNSYNEVSIDDNCCNDEVDLFQLSTDVSIHNFSIDFISAIAMNLNQAYVFEVKQTQLLSPKNNSPPLILTTPERLSVLQMYLI